ncbi:hypothetical protein KIN20_031988 [Parelaphostrongylus tenuis]|uniref:Uncharacterized protein n=1 Tax=Parelaphostrongylus tenuis TaxID=148309 RepID=A0AAD5WHQ2_PARTN|nr:hypothetical protein KIN20_031988 [Parelaphostrongylus tenuis]
MAIVYPTFPHHCGTFFTFFQLTKDIQMKGNQFTHLEEKLHQFWKQSCWICKNSGASIKVENKFVHFPCARKHGYKMDRHLLSICS